MFVSAFSAANHPPTCVFVQRMAKLAIVNAPSSFTFIWSVVKPWLSKETAEKVDVLPLLAESAPASTPVVAI